MNLLHLQSVMDQHDVVLTEAAVIETLRRSGDVTLHPRLENALLIYDEAGKEALGRLYREFIDVACRADIPILICTPTWRANRERIAAADIQTNVNGDAAAYLRQLREDWKPLDSRIIIGGLVGCKNDCYKPREGLSANEAHAFHSWQIQRLADAGVDVLLGATLPALPEATGIALAMAQTDVPYMISFVIGKEGTLLDGSPLENAFRQIDRACGRPPLGYMINCAYPSFLNAHQQPQTVLSRLIGYQANASSLEHHQLDGAETLQTDDISDWGDRMLALNEKFGVKILGGCCGTNCGHLRYITQHITGKQNIR